MHFSDKKLKQKYWKKKNPFDVFSFPLFDYKKLSKGKIDIRKNYMQKMTRFKMEFKNYISSFLIAYMAEELGSLQSLLQCRGNRNDNQPPKYCF